MADTTYFRSRADAFTQKVQELSTRYQLYAGIRIAVFLIGLILAIYFANERNATALFMSAVPSLIIFLVVVKAHNRIRYQKNHAEFLAKINEGEINRSLGELAGFDQGIEFSDEDHSYSSDLDIFGKSSLFQLTNRTVTEPGRKLLASWLQVPAQKNEILSRQEAGKELAPEVNWRQEFQASAMHSRDTRSDFSAFEAWLKEPSKILSNTFLRISAILFPILSILSIVGVAMGYWPYQVVLISLVVNGVIIGRVIKQANDTTEKATKSLETIQAYSALFKMVELKSFESKYLRDIQQSLGSDNVKASEQIEALSGIMQKFDSRTNMLFFLIDLPLLLDVQWVIQAESWKKRNREQVYVWIENISKLEAQISLAGSLFTHDDYSIPSISETYQLIFKNAGHPLINPKERVCNDFEMEGQGSEVIITGSNMSGKSTFLRTVGINMVMAYAGGPVCCSEATIPVMNIYASMRTKDNLEEHISSFYAELKRIKGLLNLFETSGLPVFYLLDEILKGTNSVDRHLGAESLVIQLLPLKGMGLISTHDLALSVLEEKHNKVKNYSFNSTIEDDEIKFDYKIHDGICKGFNASKLMEKMGIKLHIKKD